MKYSNNKNIVYITNAAIHLKNPSLEGVEFKKSIGYMIQLNKYNDNINIVYMILLSKYHNNISQYRTCTADK